MVDLTDLARSRGGLLLTSEVGRRRSGLVVVQPGVLAAATQPLGPVALAAAVELSQPAPYAFLGRAALWLHGVADPPDVLEVGVSAGRRTRVLPPVVGRRVAPSLLQRATRRHDLPVVPLELAVVQAAEHADVLPLVERLLRERRTTPARLRAACRRGVAGSAALRCALDVLADGDLELHQRLLRQALEAAGVTGLEAEVRFESSSGQVVYVDVLHRPTRRALEVDGWQTHGTRDQQLADRRRDRWLLREHGVATTRIAAVEVQRRLPALVDELLPLLAA